MADQNMDPGPSSYVDERLILNQEVYDFYKENKDTSAEELVALYRSNFEINLDELGPSDLGIYTRIKGVYEKVSKKLRGSKKQEFLSKVFARPSSRANYLSNTLKDTPKKRKLREDLHESKKEAKKLKKNLFEVEIIASENLAELSNSNALLDEYYKLLDGLNLAEQAYRDGIIDQQEKHLGTTKQLTVLQQKYEATLAQVDSLEDQLSENNPHNLKRKLKRKIKKVDDQDEILENQSELISELEDQLEQKSEEAEVSKATCEEHSNTIINLRNSAKKSYHKISYYKLKTGKQLENMENIKTAVAEEREQLEKKINEVNAKEKELKQLQNLMDDNCVSTFADGRYSDEIREVIMELYSCNVSLNKVNDVIKTVLEKLANKNIDRLPSKGLLSHLFVEARYLADKQIGEAMLSGTDLSSVLGNTLHSDGASKFHRHYEGYQITTTEGRTLSLGILEMASGDAESLFEALQDKLSDIAHALSNEDVKSATEQLVSSIKNTMSDQAAVNPVFNTILEEYRKTVLPKYCKNWENVAEDEKNKSLEMGHFFCRMHLLVNFAEEANKVILKFEDACLEGKGEFAFAKAGESGTCRLIRTVGKAFHPRGHLTGSWYANVI